MRRPHVLRLAVLFATLVAGVGVGVTTAPPAAAAETQEILLANQYGGGSCPYNEKVLIANPFTGSAASVEVLGGTGTPNSQFGVLNEAKPFDFNRKVVALWGGSTTYNQKAGIGVFDRVANTWILGKELPASMEKGAEAPHSIAVLPGGYFAVALVGSINGAGQGYVVLFDPQGNPVGDITQSPQLNTVHGVEWDGQRNALFAVGGTQVKRYTFGLVNGQYKLTEVAGSAHSLPTSGGHDLRRRRVDNDYFLTTNTENYIYRPDAPTKFQVLTDSNGQPIPIDYVKTIDQRFDGITEYAQDSNVFRFTHQGSVTAQFCARFYKGGRWIWPEGEKVYPEDVTAPPTGYAPTLTVGPNSSTWWIEVYAGSDVTSVDVIGNNGAFYKNLPATGWGSFAASPPVQLLTGQPIQLIARRSSDGSSASTTPFGWLQEYSPTTEPGWNASIVRGANCSTTWVEMVVTTGATAVSVKAGTGAWTALTYNAAWGKWVKAMNIAAGTKVMAKAQRADGAWAYSPIFTWMQ